MGSEGGGGGTVWDDITPTQENYKGTRLPRSFQLDIDEQKFWVHGNATKHIYEHLIKRNSSQIELQAMVTDFRNTIASIIKEKLIYEHEYVVGKWSIIFSASKSKDLLPVIKHAVFMGW